MLCSRVRTRVISAHAYVHALPPPEDIRLPLSHQKLGNMRGARTTKTTRFQATHDSSTKRKAALNLSGMLANPMLNSACTPPGTQERNQNKMSSTSDSFLIIKSRRDSHGAQLPLPLPQEKHPEVKRGTVTGISNNVHTQDACDQNMPTRHQRMDQYV